MMQPFDSLPDAHAPEIKQADQSKLALRLIRDGRWHDRKSLSWPPGEEPPWQQVEEAFDNLGHKDCHRNEEGDWPVLTAQGHRVLGMPARGDHSLFVLQSLTSDVVAEAFGHSLPPF